ncbi:MAG: TetR/AcrR family transcriptional regulator [Actinomycetota bacterium]|nr:TetR/AcrR family transcriptional regulator [Actinomycetota bacterium]
MPPTRSATQPSARIGSRGQRPAEREDRRTQAQRSEETTEQLLAAARRLFAEKGFAGTSIEEIVRTAGVTRGAMYHHFASKEEVFEAVFAREQERIARRVQEAAAKKKGAWNQLKAGCDEFLTAALDRETQQITFLDGPAVLGAGRIEEIECPHSIEMITEVIERAMRQGALRKRPATPLAQLLFGALCQAAMVAARSSDDGTTMKQMRKEVQRLLDALEAT